MSIFNQRKKKKRREEKMRCIPIEQRPKILVNERTNICLNYCNICNRKECSAKKCGEATVKWLGSEVEK